MSRIPLRLKLVTSLVAVTVMSTMTVDYVSQANRTGAGIGALGLSGYVGTIRTRLGGGQSDITAGAVHTQAELPRQTAETEPQKAGFFTGLFGSDKTETAEAPPPRMVFSCHMDRGVKRCMSTAVE